MIFYIDKKRSGLRFVMLMTFVAAFVAGGYWVAYRPTTVVVSEMPQTTPASQKLPTLSSASLASAPRGRIHQSAGPTDQRSKLYDAPDILAAIKAVEATGSADEKGWAAVLLLECSNYVDSRPWRTSLGPEPVPTDSQRLATAHIQQQCANVKTLPIDERVARARALREASKGSTSDYAQIVAINERRDGRINTNEQRLVESALYGTDPLSKRAAVEAVLAAIDRKAPGGEQRFEALSMVTLDAQPALSQFEAWQRCVLLPKCALEADANLVISPQLTADAERLRAVIDKKSPLQEILYFR